jgi:energy-coupling factor transporter ATP-binding protein EcfA2
MLIEISVSNFRSFREKQTFSMVAAPRLKKRENTFQVDVDGEVLPPLLKVAAIYGPNASGKSSLVMALGLIHVLSTRTGDSADSPLPVAPFRFDPDMAKEPSRIEVHFVANRRRYEFSIALTSDRIVEERLTAYPNGKEMLLFSRKHTAAGDEYEFGQKLEGGSAIHEIWRRLTGPRMLFIAQAVANSSEELKQLREPFDWFRGGVITVDDDMGFLERATRDLMEEQSNYTDSISAFLKELDVPVVKIQTNSDSESDSKVDSQSAPLPSGRREGLVNAVMRKGRRRTIFTHKTELGQADFEFDEESKGTRNLVGFWLPWTIMSAGLGTLVVDELDSSLHPNVVASLIEKCIKAKKTAQLIFTTHDTHLMDTKLLRRDQFWITERDGNGATQLRCLHEFKGREGEDIEKRYYEGRYRGLPITS